MSPLEALIKADISAHGPMPLSRYMALCLMHPEHGYYTTRLPIGAQGDFITAPEISQVFGELIGLWCADMWVRAGAPNPFHLIELGPGRGTLMADALRATRRVPGFQEALRCHFVELSPSLRAEQRLRVPDATWHTTLPDLAPALIIANEFFDALPIEQYNAAGDVRCVGLDVLGGLAWSFVDSDVVREERVLDMVLPMGSTLLAIDYGVEEVVTDTLQALKAHTKVSALETPGAADLTSHVDFGDLARRLGAGRRVFGPTTQGQFLRKLGLDMRTATLVRANPMRADALMAAAARLADPDQMGSLFKVLALCDSPWPDPVGFA